MAMGAHGGSLFLGGRICLTFGVASILGDLAIPY